MTEKVTPAQRAALQLLHEAGGADRLAGVATRTRSTLVERRLVDWQYPLYRLNTAGREVLGIRPCDHCETDAVWVLDVLEYVNTMVGRLHLCDVRLREWLVEDLGRVASVRRIGTESLPVIGE